MGSLVRFESRNSHRR